MTAIPGQSQRLAMHWITGITQYRQYMYSSQFTPNARSAPGVGGSEVGETGGFGLSKESHNSAGHRVVIALQPWV